MLLDLIEQSFDSWGAVPSPKAITRSKASSSRSKAAKKPVEDISIIIPFEAAIDLLIAYDSVLIDVICNEQQQRILSSIFMKVRLHCEASMDNMITIDHEAVASLNESLSKAVKVWVSRAIRSDAYILLEGVHTTGAFSKLIDVIQWCDNKVMKNVLTSLSINAVTIVSIAFDIFMIMLAELSDVIYLHLADDIVYGTIANWMETMLDHSTEASVSSLQPIIRRIVSLICISSTATASSGSNQEATMIQKHRLKHTLLKYLLATISLAKGVNNQKSIMSLLSTNLTVDCDMLRSASLHVLQAIVQSPDDDFQSTAHVTTLSILNQLISMKLVKHTHEVIIDLKSNQFTTTPIHDNCEYNALCKLLSIVELSISRLDTQPTLTSGKDTTSNAIVQLASKSIIIPSSSVAIDPEQWTTI